MEPANHPNPTHLLLVAAVLFVIGILIGRKSHGRQRLLWLVIWLIPVVSLIALAMHLRHGPREIDQRNVETENRRSISR